MWDVDALRDNHVKLQQMFIALRMGITVDWGACLDNTSEDSLHSGLATTVVLKALKRAVCMSIGLASVKLPLQRASQRGVLPSSSAVIAIRRSF
jgi:hypothetical protein